MQLIILIHGMWGKAGDFDYIVQELAEHGYARYEDVLATPSLASNASGVVYCTRSNEGYFTYDGIDICGLRIANEITKVVGELNSVDAKIAELSIVGYSMGGLMARYAIGLLHARGMFDEIRPHIFISTCSPHVGVNVLGASKGARLFNAIGSWSMARTSRQAFLQDNDQPHSVPLFLFLTQANTVCTRALAQFRRRILYANVVNDHRCDYYTSAVEAHDPYKGHDMRLLDGPYVPGYEPAVLVGGKPPVFESLDDIAGQGAKPEVKRSWVARKLIRFFKLTYLTLRIGVVLPTWFCAFLINAFYQRTASSLRIRSTLRSNAHLADSVPNMLENSAERMVEDAYRTVQDDGLTTQRNDACELTPLMSQIVEQFNAIGWEKYFLRIIGTSKAHSAAIMKLPKRKDFHEGKTTVRHLINQLLD